MTNEPIALITLPASAFPRIRRVAAIFSDRRNSVAINNNEVAKDALFNRLKEIFDPRPSKVMFVKGDTMVTYKDVIWAMDQARGAGVKIIGVPPKK